ncbi:MAG: response regulator transcription factor [Desulfobulbaceae bacterium]|nr:response regulator transcription factor [Desulfobulbaceae bacterium]
MDITVILADDHTLVRKGLKELLDKIPDISVLGEAEDGITAVKLARDLAPDIVLIDIGMPKLNGIDATKSIVKSNPDVAVIALSMHGERSYVCGAIEAGARGYLLKDSLVDELNMAIQTVYNGEFYLSPKIAHFVVSGFLGKTASDGHGPASLLTTREREVLQQLAEGGKNAEIGARLNISIKTVESHRRNIMRKLGINRQVELIKYALREGLVPLDAWLTSNKKYL